MLYKGWVPTVVGHLSFTSFGDTEYPTTSRRYGYWARFCIVQKRSLLDVTYPLPRLGRFGFWLRERISRTLFSLSGDIVFVMIGQWSEGKNQLDGQIFAVPQIEIDEDKHRFLTKIANLPKGPALSPTHLSDFSEYVSELALKSCRFTLFRSGEALIDTANILGGSFEREIDHLFASQFYYYLKDCFHKHQHHDATHDAIVPLFPATSSDDTSWVRQTQYRLFRHIVRFKRYRDQNTLYRASGVLAYARAFEKIFQGSNEIQDFFTDELDKSLSIRRDEIQHRDQLSLNRQQAGISWFFSLTAFLLSIAVLAQLDRTLSITPSESVTYLAALLATYPGGAVAVVWLVSRTMQIFLFRYRPYEWTFIRNIYQIFRGSALSSFVSAMCVIGIILILVAVAIVAYVSL